ncbi:MAG: alpha/beta-type small acid-soluble spore protein [Peptococcaceae bacterium]|nr:alpha/beta-type small acid-soluble spore protein [Peptococcaceae bacterium]
MPGKKKATEKELLVERLKLEIAEELGLLDKIMRGGWGQLSSVEAGKIGGMLSGRMQKREDRDRRRD